ncbi:4-amino-4-deoxy-L-arabinose transferase-like glycosyltransferase [Friedmanniella endophytica]|uniref:4-amino-4-deoxy-L-arabinose transferase-like glycosyltransferase n=1 Tax=Microlunatus kandeliicorticis TaxID=1759536 RepID=A0A7W3ITB0_9ACTN|nr:glycosyltransferase family 39 protein [Microlunatus kandeliicorticis]MBA8794823.1 4-amino-4-deoxy-L-arabinose transferase-like glycosyltransferase [Microlunatus kandeliicorticis]
MSETTLRAGRRPSAPSPSDPGAARAVPATTTDREHAVGLAPAPGVDHDHHSVFGRTGRLRRLWRGAEDQPAWARPALWLLLAATAALYLIDLTSSGYANEFYAAAVKSGTESWKAWLFGSLDSGNAITVDKPPGALWLMVLSARLFGFSSFSLLLPQALLGVGTVALVHAGVKRWYGASAALVAGLCVAVTPVAALMFRFDNPDAMLVFLMTAAAYAVIRAVDAARLRADGLGRARAAHLWMALAGAAIGFGFLTKMGQALLVLPGLVLVVLICSRARLVTRLLHLLTALVTMIVSAGWFIVLVELWPSAARPYIGGSTNNSLWELAVGYNGLGRLLGGSGNGGGGMGGGQNASFGGTAGLTRMFNSAFGTEISWLLPAALLGIVALAVITRREPRTGTGRAGVVLWGGWLVVTALVFSFMSGTIHPYYAVALVPAIGALVGIATTRLWSLRGDHLARGVLAVTITGTATWGSYLMLTRATGWLTGLAWAAMVGGLLGGVLLALGAGRLRKLAVAGIMIGALSALAGTTAFTLATAASGHNGSIPTSGPAVVSASSGMGGGMGGGFGGGPGGQPPGRTGTTQGSTSGTGSSSGTGSTGQTRGGTAGDSASSSELVALLDATSTRWSAAVVGDQSAAGYILSTDTAVMAVGGWSGSDDAPTLAQFQQYVQQGKISYFIASGQGGGGMGGGPGGNTDTSASQITSWVEAHYTAKTVGGVTVYDLTS